MEPVGLKQIISSYRIEHPNYFLYTDEAILQIIFEKEPDLLKGVPKSEIDAFLKGSVFGNGFNNTGFSGLIIEHNEDKKQKGKKIPENFTPKIEIPEPVSDNTYVYNEHEAIHADEPEYQEADPYQEALVTLLYYSNADIILDSTKYMIGREITGNRRFKDLEAAAEYILKKQEQECTKENILHMVAELLILNSDGKENDVETMTQNALANINKGNIRYINRDFEITKDSGFAKSLNACGFKPTKENLHIYQTLHLIEKDILDGTCFEIDKQISAIFAKYQEDKSINNLYFNLKDMLSRYKGSPLAERLLSRVETLKYNRVKDIKEWSKQVDTRDYRKQISEIQGLLDKCSSKEITPDDLKRKMLTEHGINLYTKEEQDKAQEYQLQNSVTKTLSGIYEQQSLSEQALYEDGGLFNNFANMLLESADTLTKLWGGDVITNPEIIESLKRTSEFWKECSPDKMSYDDFKEVFKKMFNGKEFDEKAIKDLVEYCANTPNLNIFDDIHRSNIEFRNKLEAVFGKEFIESINDEKSKVSGQQKLSMLGNIAIICLLMKYIAESSFIKGLAFDSTVFYRALGLSGKGLELATAMTVGGTTFSATTLITQAADNIIKQGSQDEWTELPIQGLKAFEFGMYAALVNVLLISPVVNPQIGKGMEAAQKLVDGSSGAVSGEEFIKAYYEASAPAISSKLGKTLYSTAVNASAFTAHGAAEDLIENGTAPLKDGNAGEYLGELLKQNLLNILTFEGVQLLISGSIAGKTGSDLAREMTVEDISKSFESLKSFTVEKSVLAPDMTYSQEQLNGAEKANANANTNNNGQSATSLVKLSDGSVVRYIQPLESNTSGGNFLDNCREVYIFNFPEGRIAVPSIADACALTFEIMTRELQYKNNTTDTTFEEIQETGIPAQAENPRLQTVNPLSDAPEPQAETGLATTSQNSSVAQSGKQSAELPITNPGETSVKPPIVPPPVIPNGDFEQVMNPVDNNPPSDFVRDAGPQFEEAGQEHSEGIRTQYKERVKVLVQDLKTMGADGKIIEAINDIFENGDADNLPALTETLTDIVEAGKQSSQSSGQPKSDPLLLLKGIFDCPMEVVPVKIEAYIYAKTNNFDDKTMLELINRINLNDNVASVAAEIIKPEEEQKVEPEENNDNAPEQIIPDNPGTSQVSIDDIISKLRELNATDRRIELCKRAIESGRISANDLSDMLDDTELMEKYSHLILRLLTNQEILEAYKYCKAENMSPEDTYDVMDSVFDTFSPKCAIVRKHFENWLKENGHSDYIGGITNELYSFLTDDNADLVDKNFEIFFLYWSQHEQINEKNIELLKADDVYREATGRYLPSPIILRMTDEAEIQDALSKINESIKIYNEAKAKVERGETLTADDFMNILYSKFGMQLSLDGNYTEDEYITGPLAKMFINENGEVPAYAVTFLENMEIKKYSLYNVKEFLQRIMGGDMPKSGVLTEQEMRDIEEYLLVTGRMDGADEFLTLAKDENGNFAIPAITKLIANGTPLDEINQLFVDCSYNLPPKESTPANRQKVFNALLEIKYLIKDLPKSVQDNIIMLITKEKLWSAYKTEEIIANCDSFKTNMEKAIAFITQLSNDNMLNPHASEYPKIFPITDLLIEAYQYIPDDRKSRAESTFDILSHVTEENFEYFKQSIGNIGIWSTSEKTYNYLLDLANTPEGRQKIEEGISIIKSENGDYYLVSLVQLIEGLKSHPEIWQEMVTNNINIKGLNRVNSFCEFILGDQTGKYPPLNEAQRKLYYELIANTVKNGQVYNIPSSDADREYLLKLDPEYYDLVKLYVYEDNHFHGIAKKICELQIQDPDKLHEANELVKKDPDIVKLVGYNVLLDYLEKIALFSEHKDLLKSFENNHMVRLSDILEMCNAKAIEKAFSILEKIPEDIKKTFPEALSEIYAIEIIIQEHLLSLGFSAEDYISLLEKMLQYEVPVRDILHKECYSRFPELTKTTFETLDFANEYLKGLSNIQSYDSSFLKRIFGSKKDLTKAKDTTEAILSDKDKIMKAIKIKCKDKDATCFLGFLEDYLDSEDSLLIMFYPYIDFNSFINYLFDLSKIFDFVCEQPQNYVNGEFDIDENIIEILKDYKKEGVNSIKYKNSTYEQQTTVQEINNQISQYIDYRFTQILEAIAVTDIETIKLLLDKHFDIFEEKLDILLEMNGEAKAIAFDLIRNGKRLNKNGEPVKLTGQQKLDMINIAKCIATLDNFDLSKYKTPLKRGAFVLDIDKLHSDIIKEILVQKGIPEAEIAALKPEDIDWVPQYLSLLISTPGRDEGELADLVRAASRGEFKKYISDPTNKYGQANLLTQQTFASKGLNFEKWENPQIKACEFEIDGQKCTISLWDRHPQSDLFMGSMTSCCTALDGANGGATANYLLNKAFQVIFLRDANGQTIGMARVYMTMVNGEPALMLDNIEINQAYKDSSLKIRDNFFEYANRYAQQITGNPNTQVYFSSSYTNVKTGDLTQTDTNVEFIGSISREEIYINLAKNWIKPEYLGKSQKTIYLVPKNP